MWTVSINQRSDGTYDVTATHQEQVDGAATAAVINTSNDDVAEGDIIRVDIDSVGSAPTTTLMVQPVFGLP